MATLIYIRSFSEVNKYEDLLGICTSNYESGELKITCKAFIESVSEGNSGNTCFEFLIISDSDISNEFTMCENLSSIEWSNPYDDYSRPIPVDLELSYRIGLFSKYVLKDIKMSLMSDEVLLGHLYNTNNPNITQSNVRIKANEDIIDKGYYSTREQGMEEDNLLVLMNVIIEEVLVDGDCIIFHLITSINDERVKLEVSTEGFGYIDSSDSERSSLDISISNINILDTGKIYNVMFTFDPNDIVVEEYVNSLLLDEEEYFVVEDLELNLLIEH
ncbi:TPA: hypothetical protein DEP90_00415 [Patescibacteria group bacterium]|nr:hypothetical protein [Patescibacteria group bacterium]